MNRATCPLCNGTAKHHVDIDKVSYFCCGACDFIFADPSLLAQVDAGESLCEYDESYWTMELESARARSYGSSLARAAEVLLYCAIPVRRFIDIGSGPGYLLDALSTYLPSSRHLFYGVEKFPPPPDYRSTHENYMLVDLVDTGSSFECGVCIEVLEHLTPKMASSLARDLAAVSVPGSMFLFNTGLTDYVRNEDPGYLDPFRRGHITSWSVKAARQVFAREEFLVHAIPGKTWAFLVEKLPVPEEADRKIAARIWKALPENRKILTDPLMGNVMHILGLESARAY